MLRKTYVLLAKRVSEVRLKIPYHSFVESTGRSKSQHVPVNRYVRYLLAFRSFSNKLFLPRSRVQLKGKLS